MKPERIAELRGELSSCHDIREREGKEMLEEIEHLQTELEAWHDSFGTSQLSHALAERDSLKRRVAVLQVELDAKLGELKTIRET